MDMCERAILRPACVKGKPAAVGCRSAAACAADADADADADDNTAAASSTDAVRVPIASIGRFGNCWLLTHRGAALKINSTPILSSELALGNEYALYSTIYLDYLGYHGTWVRYSI
jgi:hypothetical protein